jgi:hypothetical protein
MSVMLQLSAKGLSNVQFGSDDTFVFLVGSESYQCPRVLAEFVSPRISRHRASDRTYCEYTIESMVDGVPFDQIMALSCGNSVQVSERDAKSLFSVCQELENDELCFLLFNGLSGRSALSTANMCQRFRVQHRFGGDFSESLVYVSSHFADISTDAIQEFTVDEMELILRNASLVAKSEDSLYEMISARFEFDPCWFYLLEWIRFEFLSVASITHFIEWTNSHSFELKPGIWSRICSRLANDVRQTVRPRFPLSTLTYCGFTPKSALNGIIAHMTLQAGGNVSDHGLVVITAKSLYGAGYEAKKVADLTADSKFYSQNEPGQWVCYDFKDRRVEVCHYAIRSQFDTGKGYYHPKSWVIEGSIDGSSWTELDSRSNNSELNGQNLIGTWPTTVQLQSRYIRFRMTGQNHYGSHYLVFSGLELFGTLIE